MRVSAPTVHEMIGRLEADGYVTRAADKSLEFTASGQEHAAGIVRRHRLIERFLTDVFDIPWDQVHEEAERLEHWMSPMVEERMLGAIGDAKTCPHGHPIFEGDREDGVPLADVEQGAHVRVLRFENEAEDLLHYLKDTGLTPGLEGTLARAGDDEVSSSRTATATRSRAAWRRPCRSSPTPRRARTASPDQLVLGRGATVSLLDECTRARGWRGDLGGGAPPCRLAADVRALCANLDAAPLARAAVGGLSTTAWSPNSRNSSGSAPSASHPTQAIARRPRVGVSAVRGHAREVRELVRPAPFL